MKNLLLSIFYFLLVSSFVNAQEGWVQKASFPSLERSAAVGFSIGNKGYIGTGYHGSTGPLKDFWEYDPSSNTWSQKADFGGGNRLFAVAFSIGNKGYVGTGRSATNYLNDFWEYDPIANTWTRKADFAGSPRHIAVGFSIGNKGYVGTGYDGINDQSDFYEYDPVGNLWTRKANFGGGRREYATGFAIGNKGYLGTGNDGNQYYRDFWEYDPLADLWTKKSDFGGDARHSATSFSVGNKGYLGTGRFAQFTKTDFWEYDPLANSWILKSNFAGEARENAVGFSIGNKGYLGTGFNFGPKYLRDFWEYTPSENQPPIANAWLFQYLTATSVLMNSWGSKDPEGGPITFSWMKTAGPDQYTMLYGNSSTPVISNLTSGIYTFQLTVTDDQGSTATTDVTFSIAVPNQPPIANAWLAWYYSPTSVLMNSWGSHDPDGGPVSFSWSKTAGPSQYNILYGNSSTPVISNLMSGTYTFTLTVTDDQGATATKDVTFTIDEFAVSGSITGRREELYFDERLEPVAGKIALSPNPAKDFLNLKWASGYKGNAQFKIIDASGRIIRQGQMNKNQVYYSCIINVTSLTPGSYYIQVNPPEGKSFIKRFLKE